VLVQAADSPAETEHLLRIAEAHAFVAGVVGWTDLAARDAPDALARLAERPKLVGVRPMIQDIADERWMLGPALEPALRALPELGLAFDASCCRVTCRTSPSCSTGTRSSRSPSITAPSRASPTARAGAGSRRGAAISPSSRAIRASSASSPASRPKRAPAWSADDLRPFAESLFELFGPERVLWGSDWPVVEARGGWARWWDATGALLALSSDDDREAVLSRNAWRFYGLARPATGVPRERSAPQGRT
jgi:L-fuconolactonase